MLFFIGVDFVCKLFTEIMILFYEVMAILCLFIGYQPHFVQKIQFYD